MADPDRRAAKNAKVSNTMRAATAKEAADLGWDYQGWERTIAPRMGALTLAQIQAATGLAISQASRIKRGATIPHPRHWTVLAAAVDALT